MSEFYELFDLEDRSCDAIFRHSKKLTKNYNFWLFSFWDMPSENNILIEILNFKESFLKFLFWFSTICLSFGKKLWTISFISDEKKIFFYFWLFFLSFWQKYFIFGINFWLFFFYFWQKFLTKIFDYFSFVFDKNFLLFFLSFWQNFLTIFDNLSFIFYKILDYFLTIFLLFLTKKFWQSFLCFWQKF